VPSGPRVLPKLAVVAGLTVRLHGVDERVGKAVRADVRAVVVDQSYQRRPGWLGFCQRRPQRWQAHRPVGVSWRRMAGRSSVPSRDSYTIVASRSASWARRQRLTEELALCASNKFFEVSKI
jgi:hypothetical protein